MKVTGFEEAMAKLSKKIVKRQNDMAQGILDDAKANTPVGDGPGPHMIDQYSVTLAKEPGDKAIVLNTSDHAIYVHNGTEHMKARPMLLNAATKEVNKYK